MIGDSVRFGIIGCGGIANLLAEGIERVENSELVACTDLNADRSRGFADEHGIGDWYTDHQQMLDDAILDVTVIATPNGTHGEITVDCAEAGVHILCQKPLEITVERLDEMISACDRHGVKLGGLYNLRFDDGSQTTHHLIQNEDMGDIVLANGTLPAFRDEEYYTGWHGTKALDGGLLFTQACHTIDRLAWFNGGIEWVFADTATAHHDIETEDVATVSIRYRNGARGTLAVTTAAREYPHYDRIDVYGTRGYLSTTHSEVLSFAMDHKDTIDYENPYRIKDPTDSFVVQIEDMANAVREDRAPAVAGDEARHAPDAVLAMHESAKRGEPVVIRDFLEQTRES